jgi:long-chain acyl-CoA synthetase
LGGGALLDIELQRFYYAIGIPMYQGYGLTEASPIISASTVRPKHTRWGHLAYIPENMEVKICDDEGKEVPQGEKGEIVVRGENVMKGYWKNEEATAEVIRDGWLYHRRHGLPGSGWLPLCAGALQEPADRRRRGEIQPGGH